MAITNTSNEAKHGNRTTRAKRSPADPRQAADAGRDGRRDSIPRPSSRAAARSASGDGTTPRDGSADAGPIVELTIDADEDQVLEAVARLLLDLTREKQKT
jgi:hypothetical protein